MANWILKRKKADIEAMANAIGISRIFAQILVNRDINTKRKYREFVKPSFDIMENMENMKGVTKAFEIVRRSILDGEKIVVYGDYDADGVMSTAILVKGLANFGAKVSYYIPLRQEEGYGLNMNAVEKVAQSGCGLLILCDNGIAAFDEIAKAKEYGMKVIVIDHHEPPVGEDGEIIPLADAVIDPKQGDCPYEFKHMCAAGLCYRFVKAFYENYDVEFTQDKELLIMAAIATFCDIVDLTGDNRAIAYYGLEALNEPDMPNPGLKALIEERNYKGKYIDEFTIGFVIGPCINASGRLESASISVDLMLSNDYEECKEYAKILNELNEERKALTSGASDIILEELKAAKSPDKVIVVYNAELHESIAGIAAGRIKDKLHRPAIVITKGESGAKGSGRSIHAYDMFEALSECKDLFTRFGGHAMAAGFSLPAKNVDILRLRLNENCELTESDLVEIINADAIIHLDGVTFKLYDELRGIRPFGKANREPVLGSLGAEVVNLRLIDEKNTIIFTFRTESGRNIKGVAFGKNDSFKELISSGFDSYDRDKIFSGNLTNIKLRLDIVYYLSINEYNNDVSLQLSIKDFRLPKEMGI